MTPKPPRTTHSNTVSTAKTVTPICKIWKERLRTACLQRIRSNLMISSDKDSLHARSVVDDEMKQQGIVLQSPCKSHNPAATPQLAEESDMNDECFPRAHHYISEDELFELLEELENEIQRQELEQLEDVFDRLTAEESVLQHQIEDYEAWENSLLLGEQVHSETSTVVLCPICTEANLMQTMEGNIVCPNHMDGSCSLELIQRDELHLEELRERLRIVYEQHALHCNENLHFEMVYGSLLVALCTCCQTRMTVA